MHGRLYNELLLTLQIKPKTPLLIKAGNKAGIDPTLPDMEFVRTLRRNAQGETEEIVYIPGSSLRGVVRAHAERLVRSVNEQAGCFPQADKNCLKKKEIKETEADADKLYRESCYVCKLFGNTGIASRLQISDLYPDTTNGEFLHETRYGVAIDRITGAVAVGPFQMEVVTDGVFEGTILLRNFTIGQLGLLSAVLLDISDQLVALGHAKSRGLGRVELHFKKAQFRFSKPLQGHLVGIGYLAEESLKSQYRLPNGDTLQVSNLPEGERRGVYLHFTSQAPQQIRNWLESAVPRWVKEVEG